MAQCYGFSRFIINCYGLPEHHGTTNCRLAVGLAEPWSLLSDQVIGRLDVDLFCKSKRVINTCSMLLHKVFINTPSINLLYFWPKCIWLVVYLPLWKIWVRLLALSFPIYGKIKFMFQTTNQIIINTYRNLWDMIIWLVADLPLWKIWLLVLQRHQTHIPPFSPSIHQILAILATLCWPFSATFPARRSIAFGAVYLLFQMFGIQWLSQLN